jgi:hypothetical protein
MTAQDQSQRAAHAEVEAESERLIGPFDKSELDVKAQEFPAWN